LLYPLMKMQPTNCFICPYLDQVYISTKSEARLPFPNKVFVEYFNRNRLDNYREMGNLVIQQGKADGSDCYGFIKRLTYMTNAEGAGGLSEELCIHLTKDVVSKTAKSSRDAPVERLVNDYLLANREKLNNLPRRVFVYNETLNKDIEEKNTPKKLDGSFIWAVNIRPQLSVWADYFRKYVPNSTLQSISDATSALNPVLEWLISLKDDELNEITQPDSIDRSLHISRSGNFSEASVSITLVEYLKVNCPDSRSNSVINELEKFYLWFSDKYNRNYEIPVNKRDRNGFEVNSSGDKSNKEVIPTRIFKLMKKILLEDDYAWAKKIDSDWTGKKSGKGIWCPSRALMLETMMTLPIRYASCYSADMGLLDESWFNDTLNKWEYNPSGEKRRQAGVFQQLGNAAKNEFIIGFYFVQSKTSPDGLTVTWDNEELRNKLLKLREFMLTNNAIFNFDLTEGMSEDGKKRIIYPIIQPLFLDFAHRDPPLRQEPVSYARLSDFFKLLQVETERRFNSETLSGQQSPIKLIFESVVTSTSVRPTITMFTLHCLRVTGITNFALAGLEPAVIAEMLSGHKSIVMNLFYTKFGVSLINKLVSQKAHEIEVNQDLISIEDWRNDLDLFRRIIEVNAENAAFDKIDKKNFHLMTVLDGFICPNSGTRCDEGNMLVIKGSKPAEVQGGKGNCPKCRFSMTGPMLLTQQILVANKKLFELEELVLKQQNHSKKADEYMSNGQEVEEARQNNIVDSLQPEIDMLMDSWLSRISFINKSVKKLPAWEKIKSMRQDGFSDEEIKESVRNMPTDIAEKTLMTMSERTEVIATFEKCATRAEQVAINACAEQILSTGSTSCTEKLTLYLTKALVKNGSEPFIMQLDEVNAGRAAMLHAQFLTTYLQAHAEQNLKSNLVVDSSIGRIEMGKLLENTGSYQVPVNISRAWDSINKIIIDAGKKMELPVSLDELSKKCDVLMPVYLKEITNDK